MSEEHTLIPSSVILILGLTFESFKEFGGVLLNGVLFTLFNF
jgi:hypothetical protein